MTPINLSQIREELMKIKDFESLKKEVRKLITEIEKFDFKKAIPEDRLVTIEKKYKNILETISGVQNKVEKELDGVMKRVTKSREDAVRRINETRSAAVKQKNDLEKLLRSNFAYFSKKAKTSLKDEEKNIKKTIKKVRKTAIVKAKKSFKEGSKKTAK